MLSHSADDKMAAFIGADAAYLNVVLNMEANTDAGSKVAIVDDGSETGKKLVATCARVFAAGCTLAGDKLKVLKIKGYVDRTTLSDVCTALEACISTSSNIVDIGLKTASFELGSDAEIRRLTHALLRAPPSTCITPAKKVEKRVGEFASADELAGYLLPRMQPASDVPRADGSSAKAKVKIGRAAESRSWLLAAIQQGPQGPQGPGGAGTVQLPAAAAGGEPTQVRIGGVSSVKIRGPLTADAVSLAVDIARTVPALRSVALVRYTAQEGEVEQLVRQLMEVQAGTGKSITLAVKRESNGAKVKRSWTLSGRGVTAIDPEAPKAVQGEGQGAEGEGEGGQPEGQGLTVESVVASIVA